MKGASEEVQKVRVCNVYSGKPDSVLERAHHHRDPPYGVSLGLLGSKGARVYCALFSDKPRMSIKVLEEQLEALKEA